MMTKKEIIAKYTPIIRPHLSEKRFQHSVNVAIEAGKLAQKYGAGVEKAVTAGILHDIMKDTPPEEQLKFMEQWGIILTDVERNAPKLYHAISAAGYLQYELNIEDPEILHAVRYHTTARANMTLVETIVFLADFISADRTYSGVEHMREKAYRDLYDAVVEGLAFTIADLASHRAPVHPDTVAAFNQILLQHGSHKKGKSL